MQELPGTVVYTRARRRVLLEATDHGECRSLRLAASESVASAITLLVPFDRVQAIPRNDVPRRGSRARAMAACAAALRHTCDAGELRAAIDANIDILPYQLEPALAVARGETSRMLLADEVGLGKTIQAGLVLSELRARGRFRRGLILTPAGLRDQWSCELQEHFGIETVLMDAPALAALGRSLPSWVNPWTLPGVMLASIDLLKRGELLPQIESVTWDLVIVDEAHHAAGGTDRHAAAALACSRARVVVLITATPHNGDAKAFAELCALGALDGDSMPVRIFRRTRREVAMDARPRRVRFIHAQPTPEERRLRARLEAYTSRVWRESDDAGAARLAMIVLRKRALSGPASLVRSLVRRIDALEAAQIGPAPLQLALDFRDTLGGELIADDGEPIGVLSAPGLSDRATERELLRVLLEQARAAVPADSKAAALTRAVLRAREPAIVFTEYRDTLDDLRRRLERHTSLAVLHGGMLSAERLAALAAFTSGVVRVLLATDAAAEGLNLHRRCRWVIHCEAPWSPSRLEQRNGRVDRLGQPRRVHVWHLVAADTEEEQVLERLARRSATAARDVATEMAVARRIFEGMQPDAPTNVAAMPSRTPAIEEADRVTALRRFGERRDRFRRPTLARVTPRRLFAGLAYGDLLTIFQADVLDGSGHRVATLAAGFQCRDLVAARLAAEAYFADHARRALAASRHAAECDTHRERAIEHAIACPARGAFQGALFDRRAIVDSQQRDAELRQAREELSQRRAIRAEAATRTLVAVSIVAVFVAR